MIWKIDCRVVAMFVMRIEKPPSPVSEELDHPVDEGVEHFVDRRDYPSVGFERALEAHELNELFVEVDAAGAF